MSIDNTDDLVKYMQAVIDFAKRGGSVLDLIKNIPEDEDHTIEEKPAKRPVGRPIGSIKRKEESTPLTVMVSVKNKKWVQKTARSKGVTMSRFMENIIEKERAKYDKRERLAEARNQLAESDD